MEAGEVVLVDVVVLGVMPAVLGVPHVVVTEEPSLQAQERAQGRVTRWASGQNQGSCRLPLECQHRHIVWTALL